MFFDTAMLNQAVANTFCDKSAIWASPTGDVTINMALTITPAYDEAGFRIAGENISAECLADDIKTMKRSELLTIDAVQYQILAAQFDGTGWATLTLEKL